MGLFSKWVITDKIHIDAAPEKIWDFFYNIEENYRDWHPVDHRLFKWTGEPMATGSKWYAEEMAHGHLFKLKGKVGQVIPNKKIVFKYTFPLSLVSSGFEWNIEPAETGCTFTAVSYMNAGDFFRLLSKKEMDWKLEATKKHTKEEGEYLKRIMESGKK